MASHEKIILSSNFAQPEITAEEREALPHATQEKEIRDRAYFIYLQRGGQPGYDLEDWLQAERELSTNSPANTHS